MDRINEIAESILKEAIKDSTGYYYGCQVSYSVKELERAFKLLYPYGTRFNREKYGASPLFQINDYGRAFIANGGWSEKERQEKRQKKNMKIALWTLIVSSISVVISIFSCITK